MWIDLFLLFILILINGVLAMSEMALVSAKKARLQRLIDEGHKGARVALALAEEPSRFLSTVQVGITVVGILSGAIGQNALAVPLAAQLAQISFLAPYASSLALAIVVVGLTWFSVVIGELVPKRLGLLASEKVASFVAAPMRLLARATSPLVWFFSSSSSLILKMFGAGKKEEPPVTDEEINVLMEQGAEAGIFHASEQEIVSNVLGLDEQRIGAIMSPRSEIDLIDLDDGQEAVLAALSSSNFTRVIVCRDGFSNVLGILRRADLLARAISHQDLAIESHLCAPLYVPEAMSTTHLLESFRKAHQQSALVVDEYGEIQGLVTLTDVLEAIVGDVPSSEIGEDNEIIKRDDDTWLIDGGISIERLKSFFDMREDFNGEDENAFNTLGGLLMYNLGKIPSETDIFATALYRFEVVDMDKNRVDKVLLTQLKNEA